jgi:hypothetical protein
VMVMACCCLRINAAVLPRKVVCMCVCVKTKTEKKKETKVEVRKSQMFM